MTVELAMLPVARPGSILGMTTFVVILFGSNLIKHLGWRAGALATPTSMALLAAPLFTVVIASKVRERPSAAPVATPMRGLEACACTVGG